MGIIDSLAKVTVPAVGLAKTKTIEVRLNPLSMHWRSDIVKAICDYAKDQGIRLFVDTVTGKGSDVKVVMIVDDENNPMGSISKDLENTMYDCIGLSLFENFSVVNTVYFCFNEEQNIKKISCRR